MKPQPKNSQTLDVIHTLHCIGHQTDEIFDTLLRDEFGLTLARFRIMMPLLSRTSLTQADIARFNFLTEASIARQVRLLLEEGYLKRIPDKTDGRKFLLTLTKKTEDLLPKIKQKLSAKMESVYSELTPGNLSTLHMLLNQLKSAGTLHTAPGSFNCV